jgi:hypothetical protein
LTPGPYDHVVADLVQKHPVLGIALLHHRNFRGGPISFKEWPYLVELYTDFDKIEGADVVKAVQTGFSELMVQLSLERAGWQGRTVAYVLPDGEKRNLFVQSRIDPILLSVPAYRARLPGGKDGIVDGAGNIKLKKFGPGSLLFLGSNSKSAFVEFSADVLIVDEYDHMDHANLALAIDRLTQSKHPQHFRIGNPTRRGGEPALISDLFDAGDGRRWHHQCTNCNERQPIDWFVNVVEQTDSGGWIPRDKERYLSGYGDLRPVCRRCHRPWERSGTGGVWVQERPSRARRSYTMSQMDVLSRPIRRIFSNAETDGGWLEAQSSTIKIQRFFRSVLGQAWEPGEARVSMDTLQHAMKDGPEALDANGGETYEGRLVVAGVDVGGLLNVQIDTIDPLPSGGSVRNTRWAGTVRTFEEVDSIVKRYRVTCLVVDAAPERRLSQALRDRLRGVCAVWLCQFHPGERSGVDDYGMKLDSRARVATVDRTQILDATLDDLRGGRHRLPKDILTVNGFADQMGAPVRTLDAEKGRYVWTEGNKADHYRFSGAYARLAADLVQRGGRYDVIGIADRQQGDPRLVDPDGPVTPQ